MSYAVEKSSPAEEEEEEEEEEEDGDEKNPEQKQEVFVHMLHEHLIIHSMLSFNLKAHLLPNQ